MNLFYQKELIYQKIQSYMLWDIDKKQLSKTLFPIGGMTKQEVENMPLNMT